MQYQIYCDLDGVLVDFEGGLMSIIGVPSYVQAMAKLGERKFWEAIKAAGSNWWKDLEWTNDGKILWDFIKDKNPMILTAAATSMVGDSGKIGKQEWCKNHLGLSGDDKVLIADKGSDKAEFASPQGILIDDLEPNIRAWRAAGGIGILHRDAGQTILELKALLTQQDDDELHEDLRSVLAAGLLALSPIAAPAAAATARTVETVPYDEAKNMNVMAATLIGEAGGEGIKGMHAVANVIMNRAKGDFEHASGVCLRKYQFSMWNKKWDDIESVISKAQSHPRWKDAMNIVNQAKNGTLKDVTGGADFYFAPKKAMPSWADKFDKTASIGNHDFYKHGTVPVSKFF